MKQLAIRNWDKIQRFERRYSESTPVNIAENFRIANELFDEARRLRVIPLSDPLEGIAEKIATVKVLNAIRKTS